MRQDGIDDLWWQPSLSNLSPGPGAKFVGWWVLASPPVAGCVRNLSRDSFFGFGRGCILTSCTYPIYVGM